MTNLRLKTLILGGVRSGKSRLAEQVALASGLPVTYIATARAGDIAMVARIAAHRVRRPAEWRVVEEPLALGRVLREQAEPNRCLIVECLTLWLTQLLCESDHGRLPMERQSLLDSFADLPGEIVLVGNETNMGIIPIGDLTRLYCDEAGRLHQELAGLCSRVVLSVAGLPLILKGPSL